MSGDELGAKERAWVCAGLGWIEQERAAPILLCAEGERPVLVIPRHLDAAGRETAFGWGCCELCEQTGGWLFVVRRIALFAQQVGKIASALVAGGVVARLM